MHRNRTVRTRLTGGLLVFAVAFALVTEAVIAGGYFDATHRFGAVFIDLHYLVMNTVLVAAAVTLLVSSISRQSFVLLHVGLAIAAWAVAHIYWTLYVYLGGTPLTYPSVAEFGFQGFYLLAIVASVALLRAGGVRLYRPALVGVAIVATIPAVTALWTSIPIHHVLYSTYFLTVIVSSIVLAAHFLRYRYLPLFGVGLALFSVTDSAYVAITLFERVVTVPFFDPLWYVGAALMAFSLLRYDDAGEIPSIDAHAHMEPKAGPMTDDNPTQEVHGEGPHR